MLGLKTGHKDSLKLLKSAFLVHRKSLEAFRTREEVINIFPLCISPKIMTGGLVPSILGKSVQNISH